MVRSRRIVLLGALAVVVVELFVAWYTQGWIHAVMGLAIGLAVVVALTVSLRRRRRTQQAPPSTFPSMP